MSGRVQDFGREGVVSARVRRVVDVRARVALCAGAAWMCASGAHGQWGVGLQPRLPGEGFRLVDPRHGDVDSLANSLRQVDMRVDLRREVGWEKVYEAPDGKLWRFSGGLGATFSRSQYRFNQRGALITEIPAGTVFKIGASAPSAESMRDEVVVGGPAPTRIDTRADARLLAAREPTRTTSGWVETAGEEPVEIADAKARAAGKTIAEDDAYRRRRVAELVGRARGG